MITVVGFARGVTRWHDETRTLHALCDASGVTITLCGTKQFAMGGSVPYAGASLCGKCARIIETRIRRGMARAFFGSAWADQAEKTGNAGILSGKEITEIMPRKIDPAAIHAADTLAVAMVRDNGGEWLRTIYALHPGKGITLERWGASAALEAMGSGAGLFDHDIEGVAVPYVEFGSHSLQRNYFK